MIQRQEVDSNISLEDITIPSGVLDWAVYLSNDSKTVLEYSFDEFMALQPAETHTLLIRKPDRFLIYVLCPSAETFEKAQSDFSSHAPWIKPIMIPTTFYLEGVMYSHILKRRQNEWEHAQFVGTLAHSAIEKLHSIDGVVSTLQDAVKERADVAAFMYMGDSLLAAAEKWHPGFLKLWAGTLRFLGFPIEKILDETIPSYYCNYWAATPEAMKEYMHFFKVFVHALDTLPCISDDVWNDSGYSGRGPEIAGLSPAKCMQIWGVDYYPFHPFLLERLPCFYFWATGRKTIASSC